MSWENDADGYLAELSRSPGARQPATIGEVWDSEWKRTALDTIAGVGQPYGDARADLVTAIEGASGKSIEDYAAEKGIRLGSGVTQADDIRLLGSLADTLPDERRKAIEPLKDIRLNAARKAQKIEADADDVGNATYGLTAHATAFIAGVARQAADPVNVAAMVATAPLGAARGASLLATVGREAGANAAAQLLVEPVIEPQRERLGLESGFGRAAGNVLEAGIGGGVLSGMFHLAGRGVRALRGAPDRLAPEGTIATPATETRARESGIAPEARSEPLPSGPLAPASPAEQFAPDDFHAAGDLAARDHVIDAMSPVDTAEGRIDHAARVDEAAGRIESVNRDAALPPEVRPGARSLETASAEPEPATVKTVDVKPKTARGRAAADPATFSLNEFFASIGGLRPDQELAAIYGNQRGPFVPGFGQLIRKGGKTLDEALKSAKEAGYLSDPHDAADGTAGGSGRVGLGLIPRDLLDVLDAENRGTKLYKAGHLAETKIDDAAEGHAILGALDKELHASTGADIPVDPVIGARVVEIVRKEGETDVLAAYERAIMEDAERYEGLAAARQADAELAKIPGWDPDEPGAAPRDGAADPGQRRQAAGAGQKDLGSDGHASRGVSDGAGAPRQLGDPALAADAARAIEDAGGELEIILLNPDGTTRTLKASDALREVEEDARAADELNACIAGAAEEIPF